MQIPFATPTFQHESNSVEKSCRKRFDLFRLVKSTVTCHEGILSNFRLVHPKLTKLRSAEVRVNFGRFLCHQKALAVTFTERISRVAGPYSTYDLFVFFLT